MKGSYKMSDKKDYTADHKNNIDTNLHKWLTFLTNPKDNTLTEDPVISKAIKVLDSLSNDPETVRLAELRMNEILNEKDMFEAARQESKKETIKDDNIEYLREDEL